MSRRNILDDTFGDISMFQGVRGNRENAFQQANETDTGLQMEQNPAGPSTGQVVLNDNKSNLSDAESFTEHWSGPSSLSEPDSWGFSQHSEAGKKEELISVDGAIGVGVDTPDNTDLSICVLDENGEDAERKTSQKHDSDTDVTHQNTGNLNEESVDQSTEDEVSSFADEGQQGFDGNLSDVNVTEDENDGESQGNLEDENDGESQGNLEDENGGDSQRNLEDGNGSDSQRNLEVENDGEPQGKLEDENEGDSQRNLEDENYRNSQTNLEDENDGDFQRNLEDENYRNSQTNLEDENDGDFQRNLEDENGGDSQRNLDDENGGDSQRNLGDENEGDSQGKVEDENEGDSQRNLEDENERDPRGKLEDENERDPRGKLEDENEGDSQRNLEDENERDPRGNFEDENLGDSNTELEDDHDGHANSNTSRKRRKPKKHFNDKSVMTSPMRVSAPNDPVNNNVEIAINLDDEELSIHDEAPTIGWTVLEVWSCFAMIAGCLPYWISNDGRQTYISKTFFSKSLWAFSMFLHFIEILNVIPKMSENFNHKPDGKIFCSLVTHFSYALFLFLNIYASIFKEQNLTKANNKILLVTRWRLSKWSAAKLFAFLFLFAMMNSCFFVLYQAKVQSGFDIVDGNEVGVTLECLGKMYLTLSNECTISEFLSFWNIAWGLVGLLVTTHEIFTKTAICLVILISCGALFHATFDFGGMEEHQNEQMFAQVTQADLNYITELAQDISRYIGEILTGYLLMNATSSTTVLYHVFNGGILIFISGIFNNLIIFIGMFIGSVAALRINWIVDEMTSRENMRPPNARPGTAMVFDFFRDMAFRKSIGIGFPGIFVINFKTTFSYIGAVGALIALRI